MDFSKGIDGQVNKVIDHAAGVAKKKIGGMIGGEQEKNKKQEGGIGDVVTGAIGKAAAQHATDKAVEQALNVGKNLLK